MNALTDIKAAVPQVYTAIAAVTAAMSKEGIGKDRRNQQQGYNFRGIDEVYNALSPMLAAHRLCILPRMISRAQEERTSAKGGALFYTTVEAEFDFVSAEDGSVHVVRTFGEAMDSADKSTNKAMSAAYKYAAMQTFCIPTEGDNDADATTHDVAPRRQIASQESVFITDDQRDALATLASAKNIPLTKICELANVPDMRTIPAKMFADAKAWIDRQKARAVPPQAEQTAQHSDILSDDIPY